MAEIPERLKTNGRPEDQVFPPAERLFRRYVKQDYPNGHILNISLSSAVSVNRGKYSEAADVLLSESDKYSEWGVLSFAVEDIPAQLLAENPTHRFFPRHVPDENNYPHSEVWCNRLGQNGDHVVPGKTVKKMFRTLLGQRARVEIEATI